MGTGTPKEPILKRKRVAQACDSCRLLKSRVSEASDRIESIWTSDSYTLLYSATGSSLRVESAPAADTNVSIRNWAELGVKT